MPPHCDREWTDTPSKQFAGGNARRSGLVLPHRRRVQCLRGGRPRIVRAVTGAAARRYEGIVSKRLGSRYRSGRIRDWLKFKNPEGPAVKREAVEDWGR